MKKILVWMIALTLLTTAVCQAEDVFSALMPGAMDIPGAFAGDSGVLSMENAWYVLTRFIQQDADTARTAFEGMGFEVLMQENYGKPLTDHSHTSAYTLAEGKMDIRGTERNVMVVSIRGTGDGEWHSNFDFAGESLDECEYAENFMTAAEDIYNGIKLHIDACDDPVVIACGYSRGAACANLLGVILDNEYGQEDVYVYTFATPNTVRGEISGYANIFNFVNVNDCVTRMPLAVWGFSRVGTDVELREAGYVNTDMHNMFLALLGVCPDVGSYYGDRHSLTGYGLADDGMSMFELFDIVADLFSGDETLTAQAQEKLGYITYTQNDLSDFFGVFSAFAFSPDAGMMGMFTQHMPDVYIKLMTELSMQK